MNVTKLVSLTRRTHYPVLLLLLHPFNGLFSKRTWVSRHQKGKPFWILLEQEMMGWHRYQLDHMQIICTSLQTHYHNRTSSLSLYRPDDLPAAQPTVSEYQRVVKIRRMTSVSTCLIYHSTMITGCDEGITDIKCITQATNNSQC